MVLVALYQNGSQIAQQVAPVSPQGVWNASLVVPSTAAAGTDALQAQCGVPGSGIYRFYSPQNVGVT
jgi:hypothetical protein